MIERNGPAAHPETPSDDEVAHSIDMRQRYAIEYFEVSDAELDVTWKLYPVVSRRRAEIAQTFAQYFHRETPWDLPPYSAGQESEVNRVFLIRSHRLGGGLIPIAGGAVGAVSSSFGWVVTWMWVHPSDRGRTGGTPTTATQTLEALVDEFGPLCVETPLTPAMGALAEKLGLRQVRRHGAGGPWRPARNW